MSGTPSTPSATPTHTPYYQPPPNTWHLNKADALVVPILILVFLLCAAVWYLVHRRRTKIRQKKMAREESAKGLAVREARRERQRKRDEELGLERGPETGKDARITSEGLGAGSAATGG